MGLRLWYFIIRGGISSTNAGISIVNNYPEFEISFINSWFGDFSACLFTFCRNMILIEM